MHIKSLIAGTAMVLAFGVGSAIAAEPAEKTTIMPQGVQPMAGTELDGVRGTWGLPGPVDGSAGDNASFGHGTALGAGAPLPPVRCPICDSNP